MKRNFVIKEDGSIYDKNGFLADPAIIAYNIKWDLSDYTVSERKDIKAELPKEILIPDVDNWDIDSISDYISDETGYLHDGFKIKCNKTIEKMYDEMEKIDRVLEEEYKDGETDHASNLELNKERLEMAICLMEEELGYIHETDEELEK